MPVIPEEAQKEVRIAACGWVPVLGAGCDAYDLKRAVDDGNGWGIAAAVVGFLPFGDSVKVPNALRRIKDAVKLSRPAKLTQDMAKWKNRSLVIGGEKILVDSSGMKHILSRHHPKYWDGSVKKQQTFFGKEMSIDGVGDAITQIIRDKRDDVISNGGASGSYQIRGEYNGERYVVGLNNGRVAQFYPAY